MTNPLKRGSAPNRDHPDYERPGSFKPGHKKVGGRKRGTPNVLTADYKRAILEAAYRIGNDGNGRNGAVGYFAWIALHHPAIFLKQLLINVLALEFAQSTTPEQPRRTMEEINEWIRDYIGLGRVSRTKRENVQASGSPSDWTGQPFPVGTLMHLAVADPKSFCTLVAAAFLRPPAKRRTRAEQPSGFNRGAGDAQRPPG